MAKRRTKIVLSWLMVLMWMGIIYYLSNMDTNVSNLKSKNTITEVIERTVDTTNKVGITNKHPTESKKKIITEELNVPLRKCAHASVYFVLSILMLYATITTYKAYHEQTIKIYSITILFCFIYACTDEYHQTFILGRTGQLKDVLIDTLGATIGCLIFYTINKKIQKRKTIK